MTKHQVSPLPIPDSVLAGSDDHLFAYVSAAPMPREPFTREELKELAASIVPELGEVERDFGTYSERVPNPGRDLYADEGLIQLIFQNLNLTAEQLDGRACVICGRALTGDEDDAVSIGVKDWVRCWPLCDLYSAAATAFPANTRKEETCPTRTNSAD